MRPRKLLLLFLLLGAGALIETAYGLKTRMVIGPMGCRVLTGRFQGPSYSFETEETRTGVPAELALAVENAFGEVRVWKGEPGQVKLRLRKVVFLPTEEKARELAARLKPSLALEGGTLRVATNRRELEQTSDVGIETHLALEVPPDTRVRIQNEHGAASVADAREASVWSSYEAVRVERIAGAAEIDNRHGDAFADQVGGTLKLTSRYGNVEVKDVAHKATLQLEHGDARLLRVGGLDATLRYVDLVAEAVAGELTVDGRHASVKASDVKGRALVDTSYRDVELRGFEGAVDVETQRGAVRLFPEKPLLEQLTVTAQRGGIQLEVPAGSRFELEASAGRGEVQVNVPELEISESSPSRLKARLGQGGKGVTLRTDHGDISVETRTNSAAR
jgi:DUF4097 and DUF4098 domain-containing protein YvlB